MINKVILIGNLGADPELRSTNSGKAVTELRLATSFKTASGENTEWHRVEVWDKLAENVVKYTKKGSRVYVEGRIRTRSYDDKEGSKRYITEVVANEVKFLDAKGSDTHVTPGDDLPF